MRKCPYCLEEIPDEAKVCKFCSKTVVKRCPSCAEEIVATAKKCRFCSADLEEKAAGPTPVKAVVMRPDSTCGERREIVLSLVLMFVTCGIYALVLSIEDVRGDEALVERYARHCPLVALTRGAHGATLFIRGEPYYISPFMADEHDPTGAGDVFLE